MGPVIDVHAHIGHTVATGVGQGYLDQLARMDAAGVAAAFLSPAAGGRQAEGIIDTMRENDALAAARAAYPDRFPIGLAAVEPRHEELALEELERALGPLGLHGAAFHAMFSGFYVGVGDVLDPLFEVLNRRRALCLMHSMPDTSKFAMESATSIGELAARYPDVTIIIGHPSLTRQQEAEAIVAGLLCENVYLDLAFQQDPAGVERLVAALGATRILFGSDTPFSDAALTIDAINRAAIEDDARQRVLHGNAAGLIARALADRNLRANASPRTASR